MLPSLSTAQILVIGKDSSQPTPGSGRVYGPVPAHTHRLDIQGPLGLLSVRGGKEMFHHRHFTAESEVVADSSAGARLAIVTHGGMDPRGRLLDAMVETVALRGYDRTTVSRVLSNAGLQEATFSEHFYDKIGRASCRERV